MKKYNLPPFYKGQKVVWINKDTRLVKNGETVTVNGQYPCSCGTWHVTMTEYPNDGIAFTSCLNCGKYNTFGTKHYGSEQYCFAPLTESPFPSMTLKEVVKEELEKVSMN